MRTPIADCGSTEPAEVQTAIEMPGVDWALLFIG
jgi:hypothetical protein